MDGLTRQGLAVGQIPLMGVDNGGLVPQVGVLSHQAVVALLPTLFTLNAHEGPTKQ